MNPNSLKKLLIVPPLLETERLPLNEKFPFFPSYKLKIKKKPYTSSKIHFKKLNLDKLMKLNSLTNQTPINININNININNYNYYNGNQPLYLKRRINTAEVNDTFPMITKTVPNEVNIGNMFNSNNNIFKHRTNRIKLINLKKKKGMNKTNDDKYITPNANEDSYPIEKKVDKKYQNKKIEVVEDNSDSFIDELTDLLKNVEEKNTIANTENNSEFNFDQSEIKINVDVVNHNNYLVRPQTSYGGINDRKKSIKKNIK